MSLRCVYLVLSLLMAGRSAFAQQRPLVTEDPEPIGGGRVLIEGGIDYAHEWENPASGLEGNLWRVPTLGVSVGLGSIAELQLDGGLFSRLAISKQNLDAPLASALTLTGTSTRDVEDVVVGTKIKVVSERERRPAMAVRFATKLPNASNERGLGLDTTDFFMSILGAKTVQSIRLVGNVGVGILADPTAGGRQNDVLTYGFSFARALTNQTEFVGELNGRVSTRSESAFPGTETRGLLRFGGRYTRGSIRYDAGVFLGLTTIDPTVGFTLGLTYVMDAFRVP
jgi:hypothetical protein